MRRSQHARKETEFLRLKRTRLGLSDFESLKVIGRGAFGEVCYGSRTFHTLCYDQNCPLTSSSFHFHLSLGASGAENRHGSHLRHEDPEKSRHAREGTGVSVVLVF